MKKKTLTTIGTLFYVMAITLLVASGLMAKEKESFYRDLICKELGGKTEVVNPDNTRIDCLTDEVAIEVDFQTKYAECIGQAILYSQYSGKKPVCYLIVNDNPERYLRRFDLINFSVCPKVELRTIHE